MKYASQIPQESIEALRKEAEKNPDYFCHPHPAKGRYNVREEPEFWCYKCWVQALETAEIGSGLEHFFSAQNLRFAPPDGFRKETSASMAAASDLMAVDCVTVEFTPHLFDGIRDFYLTADLPTANLECTVYSDAPIGRNQPFVEKGALKTACNPRLNTSEAMLDKFVKSGIRYLSLANNHCYDYGVAGLNATMDALDRHGVAWSGANRRPEDQDKALIMEVNGIRFAMLSATFDLNGNVCEEPWRINEVRFNDLPCDLSLLKRQIASAREQNADLIVLHAHWGWEFEMYPHTNIVSVAHRLAEMGVDVIVGTHPHVAQPMERYTFTRDGETHETLIIYSLGDFVSYHPVSKNSRATYVVRFNAEKGVLNGQTRTFLSELRVLPVYILASSDGEDHFDFRLVPFAEVLADQPDENGRYRYPLSEQDRADLPRLRDMFLGILMPADPGELLAARP